MLIFPHMILRGKKKDVTDSSVSSTNTADLVSASVASPEMAEPKQPAITWQSILEEEKYLPAEAIAKIEAEAKAMHANPLDTLFASGLMTKDVFGQAIAEHYGVPYADLNTHPPTKELVNRIPEEVARKYRRVVFKETDTQVIIATDHPQVSLTSQFVSHFDGKKVDLVYALPEDITQSFASYRKALDTRFAKIVSEKGKVAPELMNEIMSDALDFRASDIHFEPHEKEVLIRFRIDGLLQEAGRLGKDIYENVLNRVKVQAHLRTDEHFASQDGAIRFTLGTQTVDIRVSILPLIDGEKIVLRLLSQYMRRFQLSDVGLNERHQQMLTASAQKPFGMILVVGPTGSGKTTSLYAVVKYLNRPDVNISTIEDPVEYKISGVNHVQVNPQTNLTFAKGLRSIVRQDPDIILVGEIRDQETAEISVNAALTGHMLLSTFHANDAASAVPRLLDMGIEPFLLSSTLELIMAQRLARRICDACRFSQEVSKEMLAQQFPGMERFLTGNTITLYKGKGCSSCAQSGFKGRVGVFEFIQVSPELRDLVMHRPSAKDITACAKAGGARSMFYDGWQKVQNGVISLDELLRVVALPEGTDL